MSQFNIQPLDKSKKQVIQNKIDLKTKPPGALGELESLALQLALITGDKKIEINNPTMIVFAGDHGVAKEGVSIAPSEVTQQMVLNFLNGGAAINCFCNANNMQMTVVDAGILSKIEHPNLVQQSLGFGTNNFVTDKAMTLAQVEKGLMLGKAIVSEQVKQGCNIIGFGEMGIGNTSAASALLSAFLNKPAEQTVGYGTGIEDKVLMKKIKLVNTALTFHKNDLTEVKNILACLGGFEIVQIIGAMLAAAEQKCVVLVDGFIASIAAFAAVKINPLAREYMVFCHRSNEQAHQLILSELKVKPLLNLGLRLGEGTGAALALPLIKSAQSFYNNMASFDDAGVTQV